MPNPAKVALSVAKKLAKFVRALLLRRAAKAAKKVLHEIIADAIVFAAQAEDMFGPQEGDKKRRHVRESLKAKWATREGIKGWAINLALEVAVARLQED